MAKSYPLFATPGDRLRQLLRPGRVNTVTSVQALREINLRIMPGQIFGIVGKNGSGKSTLLRLIAGVFGPSEGEIACQGRVAAMLELGAGFNPEFSGRDNVMISAALLGVDEAFALRAMPQIEAFAEIGAFFERPVKTYSTGMYARVAFAVMAVCEPDVLVLDEILAVGDEAFQRKCIARLETLAARGCTIIIVTHNSQLVLEFCDAAVLLDEGVMIITGDPKTVIHEYYRRQGTQLLADPAPAQFDAELAAPSPIEYGNSQARIFDIELIDDQGRAVNLLNRGSSYRLCYAVKVLAAVEGLEFGSLIKNRTGVELGGMVVDTTSKPGAAAETTAAGATYRVTMPFACNLLPDTYFFNAGVRARSADGMHYLHRIMDALAFRVTAEADLAVTGIVDFTTSVAPHYVLDRD